MATGNKRINGSFDNKDKNARGIAEEERDAQKLLAGPKADVMTLK